MVFIRRGQFYFFDGLHARGRLPVYLTERELENIEAIIKDSDKLNEENIIENAVGVNVAE